MPASSSTAVRSADPLRPASDGAAPDTPLGALVASFEELLASRVRTGERLRAMLQGRLTPRGARTLELLATPRAPDDGPADTALEAATLAAAAPEMGDAPLGDCDALLRDIAAGRTLGPSPSLGQLYREQARQEAALRAAFVDVLEAHPAWTWLSCVRGIGPTLAAQLLARLDLARAPHPSSFWAFCGLATVAATRWGCATCGATVLVPEGRAAPTSHLAGASPRSRERCSAPLARRADGPAPRVAQPCHVRGATRAFDPDAKRVCYLVGLSFTRQGGHYKAFFRERWARYEVERPEWSPKHRWFAALRVTEKLFLAHLWTAWRDAAGLPPAPRPFAAATGIGDAPLDPWAMIDREREPRRPAAPPADASRRWSATVTEAGGAR